MTTNSNQRGPGGHVQELDGIRGIAILMVVIWHYIVCMPNSAETLGRSIPLIYLPLRAFWSGVDLFFVLSGFLIGGIVLDNCRKHRFLRTFWLRRVCRICPALFVLLSCYGAALFLLASPYRNWLLGNMMPWWSYATFSQNIMMGMRGTFGGHFLAATWSLAVEEQFYLVVPIIAVLLGRKGLVIAIPMMAVGAVVLRKCFPGFHCYVNMPFRLDSLACGMAISVLLRTPQVWSQCVIYRGAFLAASVGFMIATLVVIYVRKSGGLSFLWWTSLYGCVICAVLLHQGSNVTTVLRSRVCAVLSRISYGIYLFHQPVLGLLHAGLRGAEPQVDDGYAAVVTAMSFCVTILVAWLLWEFIERHAVNYGKQLRYGDEH